MRFYAPFNPSLSGPLCLAVFNSARFSPPTPSISFRFLCTSGNIPHFTSCMDGCFFCVSGLCRFSPVYGHPSFLFLFARHPRLSTSHACTVLTGVTLIYYVDAVELTHPTPPIILGPLTSPPPLFHSGIHLPPSDKLPDTHHGFKKE